MTMEMIQEVMEMWTYSSPGLRKSLIIVYAEITEKGAAPPWMLFLADEYGFIDFTHLNDSRMKSYQKYYGII